MLSRRTLLAAALAVQALLLFANLGMLPLWGDEAFTLHVLKLPFGDMFEALRADVHPPLYYLLERFWLALPVPLNEVVKMRLLSALFAWAASAYALWMAMPRLSETAWRWFAALLTLSPCLILYGRMARSYSLQLLVTLLAIDLFLRLGNNPSFRRAVAYGLALAVVMYTHYAPAAALGISGAMLLIVAKRYREMILSSTVALIAYIPWLASAYPAFTKWSSNSAPYRVTGGALSEQVVKLGFWGLSFFFGESVPVWLFLTAIPLSLAIVWLAWQGRGRVRDWGWVVTLLAILGYAVVARWVSYPFIPARMLFILPFAYLLLAHGAEARPAAARIVLGALLFCSAAGLVSYYREQDYLNWAYDVPYPEMAREIQARPGPTIVNQGGVPESSALLYYAPQTAFIFGESPRDPEDLAKEIGGGRWQYVFVLHNTHDPTGDLWYTRFHRALAWELPVTKTHFYRPRGELDKLFFRILGWSDMAPYFFELDEYGRIPHTTP